MIKPLYDKVVIEPIENEKVTNSGIVLTTKSNEKANTGKVIAVGSGYRGEKLEPLTVKVNDKVIFSSYAGNEITYEGKKYLVISEKDILAIIE